VRPQRVLRRVRVPRTHAGRRRRRRDRCSREKTGKKSACVFHLVTVGNGTAAAADES